MDEMGHQGWADQQETASFLSGDFDETCVSSPVARTGKSVAWIACLAVDGSFMGPWLIISWKTFDNE
jgi:hypothetical protein